MRASSETPSEHQAPSTKHQAPSTDTIPVMRRNNMSRRRFVRGSIRLAVISPLIQLKPLDAIAQGGGFVTADRRTLGAAADVIIPAQGQMPAASAVGAVRYIERVAGTDQKLAALLLDGLRAIEAHAATTHSVP